MKQSRPRRKTMWDFAEQSKQANSDVLGSYTGTPADPDDPEPTQDADDL